MIDRKALASNLSAVLGFTVTVDRLRKNESRWGLKPRKGKGMDARLVQYDEAAVLREMKRRGYISAEATFPSVGN